MTPPPSEPDRQRVYLRVTALRGGSPIVNLYKVVNATPITRAGIIAATLRATKIHRRDLLSRYRDKNLVDARHAAMDIMRRMTPASLPQIGQALARDHTTVMHGLSRVAQNPERFAPLIAAIEKELRGNHGTHS